MTNVLIVSAGNGGAPCIIETIRVYSILQEKRVLNMRSKKATCITVDDIEWCDTALFVRSASLIELELVKLFKTFNKYCIYTIDDDLLSLDNNYGKDGEGYWQGMKNVIIQILKNVDCFLGVNELLAKKYVEIGNIPRYALTYTIIEHKEIYETRQIGKNNDKIKMAIYVNDGTTALFNKIIRPVLSKLCNKYPGKLILYLMALKPDLRELNGKMDVMYIPHMPYYDFKKYLGIEPFDIGLAPLDDEGFSLYKYFNKYVEYTIAGIPAIYSDCRLYRMIVQDGYNGILCHNTSEGWFYSICDLIDNPLKRLKIVNHAQDHIYKFFNSETVLNKLVKDVPQLSSYKAPQIKLGFMMLFKLKIMRIKYFFFRVAGWSYTAKQYLKQGKVKSLLIRFYNHFLKK